jgi:1-acyl-sn-glycerol-3-phosphate acyltransferase
MILSRSPPRLRQPLSPHSDAKVLITLRSLLFTVWLYGLIVGFSVVFAPILLGPRRWTMIMIRWWSKSVLFGLKVICGVKVEFRGLEHMPKVSGLIAGKHLSMLDTIAPFAILPDSCFVLKEELTRLPFFGWYVVKGEMVPVNRADAAKALKQMVQLTRARLSDARQVIIFPEGTRSELDAEDPDYKPGVAALYRDLGVPCALLATNSGQFWPAHGFKRYPGTVVFEFLPPLPADLKRSAFMTEMKTHLEDASKALIAENAAIAKRA